MFQKTRNILLLAGIFLSLNVIAENPGKKEDEFAPSGQVFGKLFSNFNTSLKGSEPQTAFEVRRAYLGYEYQISPEFSAQSRIFPLPLA